MTLSSSRVALITGAAGNLGSAVVHTFLTLGYRLVLIDRSKDRLAKLYPDLAGSPDHLLVNSTDLIDAALVGDAVKLALEKFGRLDVLINTVGGFKAGPKVEETPLEDWDFLFNINARSLFVTCRAVLPGMRRVGEGRIVNVASRAALKGDAGSAIYGASKSAAVRLTESIAAEVADTNICVNCVLPGMIDTPVNRQAMPNADFGSWVSTESIAGVIAFLASDAARDIRGASIPVFGRS